MLYNNETRALAQAPLATMMEEEGMNDKILDILDSFKERSQKSVRIRPWLKVEILYSQKTQR